MSSHREAQDLAVELRARVRTELASGLTEENSRLREALAVLEQRAAAAAEECRRHRDTAELQGAEMRCLQAALAAAEERGQQCEVAELQAAEIRRLQAALVVAEERVAEAQTQEAVQLRTAARRRSLGSALEEGVLPDLANRAQAVACDSGTVSDRSRNISVAVRLKPSSPGTSTDWSPDDSDLACLRDVRTGEAWRFDRVLRPGTSTQQLFEACGKDVVEAFCNGVNGTILTYGQTASGKTYTMQGDGNVKGVIQLAVELIFAKMGAQEDTKSTMTVSYLEIYNERVYDLLGDGMAEVRVFEQARGDVELQNMTRKRVDAGAHDVLDCLLAGGRRRRVGETLANDRSSRSHTVLQLHLESQRLTDNCLRLSQLNLVDLAGSESTKTTGATGPRLREGQNINRSLLALSQVVATLAEGTLSAKAAHVGFRDSKLTRILQQSIGGNAQTALVCTISTAEANYWESRRTLDFASRAKRVKNRASANVFKLSECRLDELLKLRSENEQLRVQVTALSSRLEELQTKRSGCEREPLSDATNRLAVLPSSATRCGVRKRADSGGPFRTAWQP